MASLSEIINGMIERAIKSSVIISPRFTDYRVDEILVKESPDIENEIKKLITDDKKIESNKKQNEINAIPDIKKDVAKTKEKVAFFSKGNVGELQKLSTEQFGNIRQLAVDPFSFVTRSMLKKLRSGLGVLFIITIATEVIKFMIAEMFKPGRPFDIRFREEIDKQVIKFLDRKEQEELRKGHKSVITTTMFGLRGSNLQGQIGGNFFNPDRFPIINTPHNLHAREPRANTSGPGGLTNPRARRSR